MVHKLRRMSAPLLALAVVALLGLCGAPKAANAGPEVYNVRVPVFDGDGDDTPVLPGQLTVWSDGTAYLTAQGYVDKGVKDDAGPKYFGPETDGIYLFKGLIGANEVGRFASLDWEEGITAGGYVTFYAVLFPIGAIK